MDNRLIDKVIKTSLNKISVEGGDVYHAMKKSDGVFEKFGEAYFSWINSEAIKGWKRHQKMVSNFIVPHGKIKVVIFDDSVSQFEKFVLSPENYLRLTIPSNLWVAFQGIDRNPSLLLNIASIKHDPAEADTREINAIAYDWSIHK